MADDTIIVYKITFDIDRYRTLIVKDTRFGPDADFLLNGWKKADTWIAPKVVCPDPQKELGDFYFLPPSSIVVRPRAKKLFQKECYFEAEYLPLDYEGEELFALNFLACRTALNADESVLEKNPAGGEVIKIIKYVFYPHRFCDTSVFKIPEMNGIETFCYEGRWNREFGFRNRVLTRHLKGLLFEPIYEFPTSKLWR
jgi:hypothetical protein